MEQSDQRSEREQNFAVIEEYGRRELQRSKIRFAFVQSFKIICAYYLFVRPITAFVFKKKI